MISLLACQPSRRRGTCACLASPWSSQQPAQRHFCIWAKKSSRNNCRFNAADLSSKDLLSTQCSQISHSVVRTTACVSHIRSQSPLGVKKKRQKITSGTKRKSGVCLTPCFCSLNHHILPDSSLCLDPGLHPRCQVWPVPVLLLLLLSHFSRVGLCATP